MAVGRNQVMIAKTRKHAIDMFFKHYGFKPEATVRTLYAMEEQLPGAQIIT